MDLNSQQIHHNFHVLKNSLRLSETIKNNAKYVIRNANREGLVRGRTHITIVAAAVYIACRETGAPRPLHVCFYCKCEAKDFSEILQNINE